jgi:chloramphenicol-sensitive protein RarD
MSESMKGVLAVLMACVIWGLSPIYYKELSHIQPLEVMSHRVLWSFVFFSGLLIFQGRITALWHALADRRRFGMIAFAAVMVWTNWFIFILSIQINRATEASLGYYIFPLVAVLIGRIAFGETLGRIQSLAVALAALAVGVLTWGLGVAPWISLVLAISFGLYGATKKRLDVGPVVSVTCEVMLFLPVVAVALGYQHFMGQGAFGANMRDTLLLVLSGPLTALPLILFSAATKRVSLGTVGVLQYVNPTLQFFCAVVLFAEPFTLWHRVAFILIWIALALFSVSGLRQDREARKTVRA